MALTPSSVPTSLVSASAIPPWLVMVATLRAAASALTSTTSTLAPSSASRRAVAPPIPMAPPVTMATRSDKRFIGEFNLIWVNVILRRNDEGSVLLGSRQWILRRLRMTSTLDDRQHDVRWVVRRMQHSL